VSKRVLALLVYFLISSVGLVFASENTTTATRAGVKIDEDAKQIEVVGSNLDEQRIFNKSRNTENIVSLRKLYRDQIEAYRNSYKNFTVAKTNYTNVDTLTSLEEAVRATRVVMENRTKVLITYLELLVATLEDTSGVELNLKEDSLKQLNSMVMALKIHQEDVVLAKDRLAVNNLSDNFEVYSTQYAQVVY